MTSSIAAVRIVGRFQVYWASEAFVTQLARLSTWITLGVEEGADLTS
jgi:hypothetical protein